MGAVAGIAALGIAGKLTTRLFSDGPRADVAPSRWRLCLLPLLGGKGRGRQVHGDEGALFRREGRRGGEE